MSSAVFGLLGVLLGSLSTSLLTIYRERLTTRREQAARDEQYERDRNTAPGIFRRDSILALQSAVSDLMRDAYTRTGRHPGRAQADRPLDRPKWETPTATGWSDAVLRLELAQARVFDDQLRSLAADLRTLAGESIWAKSLAASKRHSQKMEPVWLMQNSAITSE